MERRSRSGWLSVASMLLHDGDSWLFPLSGLNAICFVYFVQRLLLVSRVVEQRWLR